MTTQLNTKPLWAHFARLCFIPAKMGMDKLESLRRLDGNIRLNSLISRILLIAGTCTLSLLAVDPTSNTVGATRGGSPRDSDGSSVRSLSSNASYSSSATFAAWIADGCEPGTATFTDFSGCRDVVAIGSNGAYSANLSNFTDGMITYLMQVKDPAGNDATVDPPLNLGDGSANAPAGTPPELPNLLSGYAVRPSWNVAGVDYAVGIHQRTVLKDPFASGVLASALVALGGSANSSSHVITFSGVNNAVISGWDFSLEGGWTVQILSNNATIANSNFKVGANLRPPIIVGDSGQQCNHSQQCHRWGGDRHQSCRRLARA